MVLILTILKIEKISYGPIQQYIHYNFKLPNDHTNFLISGNYIIKIFSEVNQTKPYATIKFFVSEQSSKLILELMNQVMLNKVNIFNHMS